MAVEEMRYAHWRENPAIGLLVSGELKPVLGAPWSVPGAHQLVPVVENTSASAGDVRDMGSIPGSGMSPGVGDGNPL